MKKETKSDNLCKTKQKTKKYMNLYYKRESPNEKKNLKSKKNFEAFKSSPETNHKVFSTENLNTKSAINLFMRHTSNNNITKKDFKNHKKLNAKCNLKVIKSLKNEKNIKDNNNTNIKIILENKEKPKTFNIQISNQKLKLISKSNKINYIFDSNKKGNLLRERSGVFKLNKKKLLNELKSNKNNKTNIENNKYIIGKAELTLVSSRRSTDNLKQNKNKKNENIGSKNRKKLKNNRNNISNDLYYNSNSNCIVKSGAESEESSKKKNCQIFNDLSPLPIYSNNFSTDSKKSNKRNNLDLSLKKKKDIDTNLEYQVIPKEKNNKLNLNKTTKIKLKESKPVTSIEMDKDKNFLHLTENNIILKTRAKIKYKDNIIKKSESEVKNNKFASLKKLQVLSTPSLIRKCGSLNENQNYFFNFNKDKVNEIFHKNLTEENQIEKTIMEYDNNDDKTINKNDIYNKDKEVFYDNLFKNVISDRNNTFNTKVESSFATVNFYSSNIDENNKNESRNNFVHDIYNYNFNRNMKDNDKNYKNNYIKYNYINYVNKINDHGSMFKNNSNLIKRNVIHNIPLINNNKNFACNRNPNNNNLSNCNTGNTSNHINNERKIKQNNEANQNNYTNDDKNKNGKNSKKQIESTEKSLKNGHNNNAFVENEEENDEKKKLIKNNALKRKNFEEKEISLDKSASLRMFPIVHEDFIEKEDEVLKMLNFKTPLESYDKNIYKNFNNEEESEILFQNSEYSKDISIVNNRNIYQNINLDNVGLKDTSIISNIGIRGSKSITQAGKERTGHRKKNQDFYIIEKNINNIWGFNLFAILDGHGVNGHMVSQFASKYLIKKFTNIANKFNDTESIYNFLKKSDFQKIIDIFLETDNQIINQKGFDISLSGTTCVLIIQLYEHIICSNIGDSRAILIYDNNKIFELSQDSKPEVPEETKRINLMGGIVDQVRNEFGIKTGPYRVYIKNMDQPGLAMSRSFGDKKAKSCGVIPYPDIIEYTLNNDSKYMVICSDGVWEFLTNEDVMEIGNKFYKQNNINGFCKQLLKKSTEMWEKEENYIDDITIVTVFF